MNRVKQDALSLLSVDVQRSAQNFHGDAEICLMGSVSRVQLRVRAVELEQSGANQACHSVDTASRPASEGCLPLHIKLMHHCTLTSQAGAPRPDSSHPPQCLSFVCVPCAFRVLPPLEVASLRALRSAEAACESVQAGQTSDQDADEADECISTAQVAPRVCVVPALSSLCHQPLSIRLVTAVFQRQASV